MKLRILDPSVEIVDLLFVASETHTSFPLALVQFSLFHHLFPLTVCVCALLSCFRHVRLFATPWTVAHQAPLSMGFSRQEYWSGSPFPSPEDLPFGMEPRSPTLQADALPSEAPGKPEVKVIQSCPTICNPIDYTAHGIVQARILEWVAFPFSRGPSQPRDRTQASCTADRFFTS